jgi:FKBP-type peptidyl-prolyl cis-trans isomerase FklB
MTTVGKRASLLAVTAFFSVLLPGVVGAQGASPAAGAAIASIQLTYKRDPRLVDPTRGLGPWVDGPGYTGATAQDTVEARAEGVDAAGKPMKISPDWIASDPAMVTVSPRQGNDVKITVHRAGESKLKITYRGLSEDLVVRANHVSQFMLFEIRQATAATANAPATEAPPARKTRTKNDLSYAAGMNLAKALKTQSIKVNEGLVMQGFKDAASGGKTLMTEEEALAVLNGVQTDQRILEANLDRKALAEKNKREGEAFLAANKTREGVVTLPSGLQYKIRKAGQGKKPTASDVVNVQYRGTFIDGKEFDNRFGRSPVAIPVKAVFKGWTEALQLMPAGSRWQLFVPSDLAYGEHGAGGGGGKRAGGPRPQIIGPNTTLIFEVELISVQEPGAQPLASDSRAQKQELTPEMLEQLKKVIQGSAKNQ